jgi:hypothetical protein
MRYLGTSFSVSMGADDQDKWTENWERTFGKKAKKVPAPECLVCCGTGEYELIVNGESTGSCECSCLK